MNVVRTPPPAGRTNDPKGNSPTRGEGEKFQFNNLLAKELKEILKGIGLATEGNKAALVTRLEAYAKEKDDVGYSFVANTFPHLVKLTPHTPDNDRNANHDSPSE